MLVFVNIFKSNSEVSGMLEMLCDEDGISRSGKGKKDYLLNSTGTTGKPLEGYL